MDTAFYLFAAGLLLAGGLASIAVWSPRGLAVRAVAVALLAGFIPVSYLVYTEMLSRPKPVAHEWWWRDTPSATLLGVSLHEGKAIYVWLRFDGVEEPRYYVLPWRRQLAERLQAATDTALETRGRIELRRPFWDPRPEALGELGIDVVRPPRPPAKPLPPPVRLFDPRGRNL